MEELNPIVKILISNSIMEQPKYSSAMDDNNNNGKEGGFPGFPNMINTSPMPSPSVNFMFPNSQVSANNRAKEGFADRQPPPDFSWLTKGHVTKDHSEQVPLNNDAKIANYSAIVNANNNAKMPMPNFHGEAGGSGSSVWKNIQSGAAEGANHSLFWKANGLEMRPSTSVVSENSGPISTENVRTTVRSIDLEVTPEISHGSASDDTQESMPVQEDVVVENRYEPIKRKRESFLIQYYWPAKPSRDPKVVVQIESKDDVPDDGYCWRKYGQKKVKGNTNPRSYYKCTSGGCYTKKHVERAPHDANYVVTSYEGKHNHGLPTAARRSKNKRNSLDDHIDELSGADHHQQITVTLPPGGNPSIPMPPESADQFQTPLAPHFERAPEEFLMPNMVGSFSDDNMNHIYGSSTTAQMSYSSWNNTNAMPYGSYGLNLDPYATPHPTGGSVAPVFSGFPLSPVVAVPPLLDLNLPPPLELNWENPMGPEA